MSEGVKKLWPAGKLKKDHFLIMILVGILFLVIVWPTGEAPPASESGFSDSLSGMMELPGNNAPAGTGQAAGLDGVSGGPLPLTVYTEYLETKLETALAAMEGAGRTKVMITFKCSAETVVEKDTPTKRAGSTEVDAAGGSRNTTDIETPEETVYYTNEAGQRIPYVKKTVQPLVEGVLVVTQGGENEKIIRHITEVIKALFGIDEHKIKIVKMV